jgi:Ni,Fe-hydrogenase III small subunit/formate hydrogenlyase subunit 6/NADH:ubiquinone oxidoreductase subunit I
MELIMIKAFVARLKQGHRTIRYPAAPPPALPDRFRGRPVIEAAVCPSGCRTCVDACPTGALSISPREGRRDTSAGESDANRFGPTMDLGRCLFCTDCERACPSGALGFSDDYRLSVRRREELVLSDPTQTLVLAEALGGKLRRVLGRSLKLRQVSAGGCNACEADVNVLGTIGWDLGRFGIQMVASPRHADGLLVTGPVTKNMELALRKTYDAVPGPKIVIAVGACAISGGPYIDHAEVCNGVASVLPVDLFLPGCPPHPLTILDGLLRLIGRPPRAREAWASDVRNSPGKASFSDVMSDHSASSPAESTEPNFRMKMS